MLVQQKLCYVLQTGRLKNLNFLVVDPKRGAARRLSVIFGQFTVRSRPRWPLRRGFSLGSLKTRLVRRKCCVV